MDNLKTTTYLVKGLLESDPDTRNSDNYLFYKVVEKLSLEHGFDATKQPFGKIILQLKTMGFPQFETVRRTRQKIQHAHPELAGCDEVEAQRRVNEEVFREYARQVID